MSLTPIILRPLSPLGEPIATSYQLRLINAQGRHVEAIYAADGSPVLGVATGTIPEAGLTLHVIPQSQIATADGAPTWWHLVLQTDSDAAAWRLSVPDSAAALDMLELTATSAVAGDGPLAVRLLPAYGDTPDGWTLALADGAPAWVAVPPGSGIGDAPLTGGPYGREGGAWVEAVGPPGAAGPKGDTGAQGPVGAQGPKGDTGATGATGATGPKGDTGSAGAAGATGPQGPAGEKGDTGSAGAQGPKGDTGSAGATGSQGPKGDTGSAGAQGETGPQGPKGETGSAGATGAQGPIGPNAVSTSTSTTITGLLKGDGSHVAQAGAGTDYEAAQTAVSQAEAEAGTGTAIRSWSPVRVWQAIAAKVTAILTAGVTVLLNSHSEKRYAATTTGNVTIDLANGNVQDFLLDGNRQFTMPPIPPATVAANFVLHLSCAGFTPTWNTSPAVMWQGGVPVLNTTAGKTNILTFVSDYRNTRWIGLQSMKES